MIIAPRCVAEQFMNDQAVPFDTVLRNLRYGYPLSPQVWCMVKPRGHFILAVPVFEDRHQCSFSWNLQHLTANSARRCLGFLVHFASKFCVLLYWQRYCTALEQCATAKLCGVQQTAPPIFDTEPPRSTSAHILVKISFFICFLFSSCRWIKIYYDRPM